MCRSQSNSVRHPLSGTDNEIEQKNGTSPSVGHYDGKLKELPPLGNEDPTCCSARGGGYARGSGVSCPWG